MPPFILTLADIACKVIYQVFVGWWGKHKSIEAGKKEPLTNEEELGDISNLPH